MGNVTVERLDRLFWLGRYVERVYQSAKNFEKQYDMLIDGDDETYREFCRSFGIGAEYPDRDSFIADFYNPENPHAITANITRAYDNAMVMRDEISTAALSYIHLSMAVIKEASVSEAPMYEMQKLEDYILAFWGSLDENVDSEETRSVVKVGKRIERLDLFIRFKRPQEELRREMQRLMSRLAKSNLSCNRSALLHAAAMIEDEETDYDELLKMVLRIF